jgi:hypothetical protein
MVLSSSVTKKLGKTGNALCSDETLELDPATQAALATGFVPCPTRVPCLPRGWTAASGVTQS